MWWSRSRSHQSRVAGNDACPAFCQRCISRRRSSFLTATKAVGRTRDRMCRLCDYLWMTQMTTAEAALRLGVSQRQVQRLIEAGELPATRTAGDAWVVDAVATKAGPPATGPDPGDHGRSPSTHPLDRRTGHRPPRCHPVHLRRRADRRRTLPGRDRRYRPPPQPGRVHLRQRHRAPGRVIGPHCPSSVQPWRQPPTQPRPLHDRDHPDPHRHRRSRLLRAQTRGGKTSREAIRCLKRRLSDQVYKAMRADTATYVPGATARTAD